MSIEDNMIARQAAETAIELAMDGLTETQQARAWEMLRKAWEEKASPPNQQRPEPLTPFSREQARRFGQTKFPNWGMAANQRLDEIPTWYLAQRASDHRKESIYWRDVERYLATRKE